eukprot:CAMPEP_0202848412 /NCGR_PEP_ID=MMETSP1389-20130828/78058_1 /ASSEMBLY_ACC=CAM_ASM_000865 /TAXON_ID=302021 /ORGANISM="Rhodomonas sp., Strain CCMP768" /LENGTH=99 /DNA_ID=CAMNT_0049526275 /DNA_START=96 /DNA_END=393 /DNA_ORIENTATION=-
MRQSNQGELEAAVFGCEVESRDLDRWEHDEGQRAAMSGAVYVTVMEICKGEWMDGVIPAAESGFRVMVQIVVADSWVGLGPNCPKIKGVESWVEVCTWG